MARSQEGTLKPNDYLWPLTGLRDVLLRPDAERDSPIPDVGELVRWNLVRLKKPWQPFGSATSSSRTALDSSSVTIPHTSAKLPVDEATRSLAKRISDEAGIDEIEAFILCKSYSAHSIETGSFSDVQKNEDAMLDRLLLWYEQQLLAVPQIVMALYVPESEPTTRGELAAELRTEIIGDDSAYIESLFRAFSSLAQKEIDAAKKEAHRLFWATLQLRQQETLLDLLFLILYQFATRPAAISEGLIKGTVLSSFGKAQANIGIWEKDLECQRLQGRVCDLLVIIAVEAMCLAQVISPEANDENTFGATLLHSRDRLHGIHQFLMDQSSDLADDFYSINEFPTSPIAILCLGWAIVLRSLPPNLQPPSGEDFQLETSAMDADDPLIFLGAANRALRPSSGFFPWLESILSGQLLSGVKDAFSGDLAVDMAALRRSPLKDLVIGLSGLIRIDSIRDQAGLYRTWSLLFGGGPCQASLSLSHNYWTVDFAYEDRRAILDDSLFPKRASFLLGLLAALTGLSSDERIDTMRIHTLPVEQVFEYFHNLPEITFVSPRGTFTVIGRDGEQRLAVETTVDYELPGGVLVPCGTRGILNNEEDDDAVVTWRWGQSGWPLLIEILRGAAGLQVSRYIHGGARKLSLTDLGVEGSLPEILNTGLLLIRSVLRSPAVASLMVYNCSSPADAYPGQSILDLALQVACSRSGNDMVGAQRAVEVLESLLLTGASGVWQAFRASGFFDTHLRRHTSVSLLVQNDAARGHYGFTTALLRLIRSLSRANTGDALVLRASIKLCLTDIWSQFWNWRYNDLAKRYEVAILLMEIFDVVLRHPLGEDGKSPTPAAGYLFETFMTASSPITYKPLVDVLTQATPLSTKYLQTRRWNESSVVFQAFDQAASLLATLVRLVPSLHLTATSLPSAIFSSTVVTATGDRIQLVDSLFELISQPALQPASLRLTLRLLKVYFETSSKDEQRPSLAGMLRDAEGTCGNLSKLASSSAPANVRPDAWALLAAIVLTQPGCAAFCIGKPKDGQVTGTLLLATEEALEWKVAFRDHPRALAVVLSYCQAVLESPSATTAVTALRTNEKFWQAIHDVATKNVPLPSSLSEDIGADVQDYSYSVQAKANATSLLATELAHTLRDESESESKAQSLVVSLFRNGSALQDATLAAIRTACDPAMHTQQDELLKSKDIQLVRYRTVCLPNERDYGVQYLYDGVPVIFHDLEAEQTVAKAIAMLNLNWSQLDADISLTKAFRLLCDVATPTIEGDALAAKATLRTVTAAAEEMSREERGGDVMLAIQTERLGILATLLDTALALEIDVAESQTMKDLAGHVRKIVESSLFPPMISLRHQELPPIHRPVLRILSILSVAKAGRASDDIREVLFDSGASFTLEAADVILDAIVREPTPAHEQDLALVVAILCEMSRMETSLSIWLDKLMQVSLIPRSLEVILRTRPVNESLPPHFHTILLLHLALASNSATAEKLAVSGVLPTYADNVVAVAAEQARIDASTSLHSAWCGMLLVVKALLSSLYDAVSYARSDVLPWIRVVTPQIVKALSWDGTPVSRPMLDELELICDVFYGLANAVGGAPHGLLQDFGPSALDLLRGVRYALSHPHRFCALLVPSSEEEQQSLEGELEKVEQQKEDVNLFDNCLPVVASRAGTLLRVARTMLVTLVRFSRGWELLNGELDGQPELLLPCDDEHILSSSSDPVGVVNDLYTLLASLASSLPVGSIERKITVQAMEAAALLSVTQLLARRQVLPDLSEFVEGSADSMDIDSTAAKRRSVNLSSSMGPAMRSFSVRRELEADVRGMLPDPDPTGVSGHSKMLEVLKVVADREFSDSD